MPLSTRCLVLSLLMSLSHEEHLSTGGVKKARDGLEKGGLAGAVGPDKSHDRPFLDLEGDVRRGPGRPRRRRSVL